MAYVRNVSGQDLVISVLDRIVPAGATVEVPDDLLGRKPKGDDDQGAGLLAQPANWERSTKAEAEKIEAEQAKAAAAPQPDTTTSEG